MNAWKKNKDRWIIGLALFSMFFGAGNVIFPPYLGMESASMWFPAFACYYLADIGLAVMAIFAMLKCDSDIDGVTRRVGRIPSFILSCVIVLCVGPLLAVPRTAATTFEMSVAPLFPGVSPVICSVLFFSLIFCLCVRESSVVDIVGKFLTPALFIGLLIVIIRGIIAPLGGIAAEPRIPNVIIEGIYSGYQTMDVLGALVFGVIIFKTAGDKGYTELKERRQVIGAASIIAGLGLLIVYGGLAYLGATSSTLYGGDVTRAELVLNIVRGLMGNIGTVIFGVVVALACITTAIALVSSTGTYFSRITNNKLPYGGVVAVICIFSAVVSNVGLDG
ncbi:MAG: branched-chain amino acid transport system II carrier protein, partial [Eubacterium sp.]